MNVFFAFLGLFLDSVVAKNSYGSEAEERAAWNIIGDFGMIQNGVGHQTVILERNPETMTENLPTISTLTLQKIYVCHDLIEDKLKLNLYLDCPVAVTEQLRELNQMVQNKELGSLTSFALYESSNKLNETIQFFHDRNIISNTLVDVLRKTLARGMVNLKVFKKPGLTARQIRLNHLQRQEMRQKVKNMQRQAQLITKQRERQQKRQMRQIQKKLNQKIKGAESLSLLNSENKENIVSIDNIPSSNNRPILKRSKAFILDNNRFGEAFMQERL